jgi:hypothetical protein
LLAGRASSEVILGRSSRWGCSFDADRAGHLLMAAGRDLPAAKVAFHECLGHAKCLIRFHRGAVERVARALLAKGALSGTEIDRLTWG